MIIVMLLNLLYIVLPFCLSLQRLELSGLRLQPRSNSATSLIRCSVWHKYLCLVFPIELIRDQKFSDVQVHFSRQLKQRTA